jgi:hypothetical protein
MKKDKYEKLINSSRAIIGGKGCWHNFEEMENHDNWLQKKTAIEIMKIIGKYADDHIELKVLKLCNEIVDLIMKEYNL